MIVTEYFCDYCGKQIEQQKDLVALSVERYLTLGYNGNDHLDLCVNCVRKIFYKKEQK